MIGRTRHSTRLGVVPRELITGQSRAGAAALAVGALVMAAAVLLTAAVPASMRTVATHQVRSAVEHAGTASDMVVTVPYTDSAGNGFELAPSTADAALYVRDQIEAGMPADLRGVLQSPVTTIVGPELKVGAIAGSAARIRFVYVARDGTLDVTWVAGRAPGATETPLEVARSGQKPSVEVGLSEDVAELMGVVPGDALPVKDGDGLALTVTVTGIYRPASATDPAFATVPTLLSPHIAQSSGAFTSVAALTTADSLPAARLAAFPNEMRRFYTYRVYANGLTADNVDRVAVLARGLASGREVFSVVGGDPSVATRLDAVLEDAVGRNRAAAAQAAVLLLALVVVMTLTQVLAANVLIERRASVLTMLRTRGASVPLVGLALLAESAVIGVISAAVAISIQQVAVPGAIEWAWVAAPLAVAVVATPVLGMRSVARRGSPSAVSTPGRRALPVPELRRVVAETALVVLAVAALLSLRGRGVAESESSLGADALVLAAPALCALAVGALVARALPWLQRRLRSTGARLRGAGPLLAAARVRSSLPTTLAFVVAGSVVALAATTAATVTAGQAAGSWDALGADAVAVASRNDTLPAGVTTVAESAGVPGALVSAAAWHGALGQLARGSDQHSVNIVAVNAAQMARLAAEVPGGDPRPWQELAADVSSGAPLPMLQPAELRGSGEATLTWDDSSVMLTRVGAAPVLAATDDDLIPTVVVDREALAEATGLDLLPTVVWAVGTNAEALLRASARGSSATVATRSEWLTSTRSMPVTTGLRALLAGSTMAAAALAALGVALVVAAGSRDRERSMARLRVVGLSRRAVGRVARAEVVLPIVIASAVGVALGFGLAAVLTGPLGLASITGQIHTPPTVIAWWTAALPLALGVLAWTTVGLSVQFGRTLRLGEVMRAG